MMLKMMKTILYRILYRMLVFTAQLQLLHVDLSTTLSQLGVEEINYFFAISLCKFIIKLLYLRTQFFEGVW